MGRESLEGINLLTEVIDFLPPKGKHDEYLPATQVSQVCFHLDDEGNCDSPHFACSEQRRCVNLIADGLCSVVCHAAIKVDGGKTLKEILESGQK